MEFLSTSTRYTTYYLYTRKNPEHYQILIDGDGENVKQSTFDPQIPTKIIVHGYRRDAFDDWAQMLKGALLKHGEYNVISVDWNKAATAFYPYAIVNTYKTSKEIARMISFLKDVTGSGLSQFHVIGTTLGGQLVSYVGKHLDGLGRVTSLDPAAPGYLKNPPEHRIDIGDALFVDIIHTNAEERFKGYGYPYPVAHVDFYPNGGVNQPGCLDGIIATLTKRDYDNCNHRWANFLFIDSILNPQCPYVAYACSDWDTFLEGRCADCGDDGQNCAVLGLQSDTYAPSRDVKNPRKYFLKTNSQWPYCLYHYQIIVKLSREGETQYGSLYLTLEGQFDKVSSQLSKNIETFVPGETYVYLVTSPRDIGLVETAKIFWLRSLYKVPDTKDPMLFVEAIQVKAMSTFERRNQISSLCGNGGVIPNLDQVLTKCSERLDLRQSDPVPRRVKFFGERIGKQYERIKKPNGNPYDYRYFIQHSIKQQ
ncbi:pancreatic triacylglycerol lipase-like [Centruroides vittatus]|uniref:pancreatic triacylglycerol lipase-like n=1 Tax=Centruroides vittatus TaxID=120091 RepID=UPI003510781F